MLPINIKLMQKIEKFSNLKVIMNFKILINYNEKRSKNRKVYQPSVLCIDTSMDSTYFSDNSNPPLRNGGALVNCNKFLGSLPDNTGES